jgi:hypothetical protein
MWVVSGKTGQVYKNGIAIIMDDSNSDYQDYLIALNNGLVDYVPYLEQEILTEKIPLYRSRIYDHTEKLFNSSKARALNKTGQGLSKSQLDALEIFYIKKNDVATQYLLDETVNNESIFELIQFEEDNDFSGVKLDNEIDYLNSNYNAQIPTNITRIKQYCYLIKVKFDLGKQLDEALKSLCEIFRSKLITNLDNLEFEKIDQRIELIQTITNDTSIAEVLALKTPFDAI